MMVTWPAKLLLFGEYTVLLKGEALAIPLTQRSGYWSVTDQVDPSLLEWARWLNGQEATGHLPWPIDTTAFLRFVKDGGSFESNIPSGCGMGSSGALVAALAEQYSTHIPGDLNAQIQGLAFLEKYFHGNSSGMDPLVSLTRKAIHQDPDQGIHLAVLPVIPPELFLVDTGLARQTAPLVHVFRLLLEQEADRTLLLMELLPQVHRAIHAVLHQEQIPFNEAFSAISRLQARLFRPMIPDDLYPHWDGPQHQLKLCGAGGGGYFLGRIKGDQWPDLPYPVIPLSAVL
ncbi:MAG: hypothetical protein K9I85_15260 [Saprospiraceae bacterium]|nr:hypothetical protein [Saprospiraceae bacterium]